MDVIKRVSCLRRSFSILKMANEDEPFVDVAEIR